MPPRGRVSATPDSPFDASASTAPKGPPSSMRSPVTPPGSTSPDRGDVILLSLLGIPMLVVLPLPLPAESGKIYMALACLAVLGAATFVREWVRPRAAVSARIAIPALLLTALAGLSILYAPYRHAAAVSVAWWLALLGAAAAMFRLSSRGALRFFVATAVAVAAVYAAASLFQYGGFLPQDHWAGPVRLAGPFSNSNLFAAYLCVHLFVALGLALDARSVPGRIALLVCTFPMITALVLTVSRGGWIAACTGAVVMIPSLISGTMKRLAARRLAPALGLIVLAGIVVIAGLGGFEKVHARLKGAGAYSVGHRVRIWKDTVSMIAHNPLGAGAGMFRYAFPPHRTFKDRFVVNFAHSDLLEIAADLGIQGLAAGLVLAAALAWALRRRDRGPAGLRAGTRASLCSILVMSLYDFPLHKPAVALAFVWIAAATIRLSSPGTAGESSRMRRGMSVVLAAASAGVIVLASLNLASARLALRGREMMASGRWLEAVAAYGRASALSLGNFEHARAAGDAALKRAFIPIDYQRYFQEAADWYGRAARENPTDAASFLGVGLAAEGLGRLDDAEHAYQRAMALDPMFGIYREYYSAFLLRNGRITEGMEAFAASLEFDVEPAIPRSYLLGLLPRDRETGFHLVQILARRGVLGKDPAPCLRFLESLDTAEEALEAGRALAQVADTKSTLVFYSLASRRFPGSREIRRRIKALTLTQKDPNEEARE